MEWIKGFGLSDFKINQALTSQISENDKEIRKDVNPTNSLQESWFG
jgi:hypothetical protein